MFSYVIYKSRLMSLMLGAAMKLNVPLFAPEGTQLSINSPKNAKGYVNTYFYSYLS